MYFRLRECARYSLPAPNAAKHNLDERKMLFAVHADRRIQHSEFWNLTVGCL